MEREVNGSRWMFAEIHGLILGLLLLLGLQMVMLPKQFEQKSEQTIHVEAQPLCTQMIY